MAARLSRYFCDTEFLWDGQRLHLISIAVVTDGGREFYEHCDQYDPDVAAADPFLAGQVLPAVDGMPRRSLPELATQLEAFLQPRPRALWADLGAWDHIALMQIWGRMTEQPPWMPCSTKNVRDFAGLFGQKLPPYPVGQHDALVDARHVRDMFRLVEFHIDRTARIYQGV